MLAIAFGSLQHAKCTWCADLLKEKIEGRWGLDGMKEKDKRKRGYHSTRVGSLGCLSLFNNKKRKNTINTKLTQASTQSCKRHIWNMLCVDASHRLLRPPPQTRVYRTLRIAFPWKPAHANFSSPITQVINKLWYIQLDCK